MKNPSEGVGGDLQDNPLRNKILGLGDGSVRKSYYPVLQQKMEELELNLYALRQSDEKFRMLLRLAPDAFFHGDPSGFLLNVNEAALALTGHSREELLTMNLQDLFPEAEMKENPLRYDLLASGEILKMERVLRKKDGSMIPVEMVSRKMPDGTYQSFIRDISERRRAESELRAEREQLLSIFDSIEETVYISDPVTYEILYANKFLEEILGKKVVGKLCYRELQGFDSPCEFCTNKIIVECKPVPYRWEYYNKFLKKHVSIIDRIIKWPDGRDVRFELAIDITGLKNAEAEREKLNEKLAQAQKLESIGRLAGGVAHDFNNMLSVIIGHCEFAQSRLASDDPVFSNLDEILKAAKRSADLTQQLLAFARKQTVTPKVLNLNETISGMLKMLSRLIGEDIELKWLPGRELWNIRIDPSQVDQILANLCVNARDAISGGDGKITIETSNVSLASEWCSARTGYIPGDYVVISISDNGCGMSPETVANIFEPFFTTKALGKGTGLGLSTVYGIVKQNNGFVNVYSEPGTGTTFRLYLPKLTEKEEFQPAPASEEKKKESGNATILLVEDEPAILKMTAMLLERLGYTVVPSANPSEALQTAREFKGEINLLMTDVIMPEMNGRDLAMRLQSIYPNIKRLFMSGYTADVIAHHGVLDEGVNFIQKPFSITDLAEKVRKSLE